MLKAENVSVTYSNGTKALQDASVAVRRGQLVVMLGPNGSGKTSLVRALTGVVAPASGTVSIDGTLSRRDTEHKRKIMVMPQALPSTAWMLSPKELIEYVAHLHGASRNEAKMRAESVIEYFNLGAIQRTMLFRLSGGQARLSFLAACTSGNGEYLILDEPTISLDPLMKERVWNYLEELRTDRDWGVLVTSHQLDELEDVVDEMMFLNNGRAVWQGTADSAWAMIGNWMIFECVTTVEPLPEWKKIEGSAQLGRQRFLIPEHSGEQAIRWARMQGASSYRLGSMNLKEIYKHLLAISEDDKTNG